MENSMRSIARALNAIALAIENLANALNPSKKKPDTFSISTTFDSTPINPAYNNQLNPPHDNPYMDTKKRIDFSYNTYGSLSFDEREALYKIYKAIFNKGVNEPLHDKMLANLLNDLKRDWPSLHSAIDSLVQSKKINYYRINSNKHYH